MSQEQPKQPQTTSTTSTETKKKKKKTKSKKENTIEVPNTVQISTATGTPSSSSSSSKTTSEKPNNNAAILTTGPIEEQPLLLERRKEKESKRKLRNCLFWFAFIIALGTLICGGGLLALPATFSCLVNSSNYYVVKVSIPNFTSVSPPVVCAETLITITVTSNPNSFIILNNNEYPNITISGKTLTNFQLLDCQNLEVRQRKALICSTLIFNSTFPDSANLLPYDQEIEIVNPRPYKSYIVKVPQDRNCSFSDKLLTVIPAPRISSVYPPFLCMNEQTSVKYEGVYFLESQKKGQTIVNVPSISICGSDVGNPVLDNCNDLPEASGYNFVRKCSSVTVNSSAKTCSHENFAKLSITNPEPAICSLTESTADELYVSKPPEIALITPSVVCSAEGTAFTTIRTTGIDIIEVDWGNPVVNVRNTATRMDTSMCSWSYIGGHALSRCQEGRISIPKFDDDVLIATDIEIASSISTCSGTTSNVLILEPRPLVQSVTPASICEANNPQSLVAKGRFVIENTSSVSIAISSTSIQTNTILSDCTTSIVAGHTFYACSSLNFTLPSNSPNGKLSLSATTLCSATLLDAFSNVPTPTIASSSLKQICFAANTSFVIDGSNFLLEDGNVPDVKIGGVAVSSTALSSCSEISPQFSLCSQLNFTVNSGSVPVGTTSLVIKNGVASCSSSEFLLEVVPAPTIASFTTQFCENQGADVQIIGTNFAVNSATVYLQSTTNNTLYQANQIVSISTTQIIARFLSMQVPSGSYDIVIKNSPTSECQITTSSGTTKLIVHSNTLGIWTAEPSVIMSDETISVTFFATNFESVPVSLTLLSSGTNITFVSSQISHETGLYDRLTVVIPAGLTTTPTSFNVMGLADTTCRVTTSAPLLNIVTSTTFTISTISPVVAYANETTTITIKSSSNVFTPSELPNVFLSGQISQNKADTAHLLENVQYISATAISAIIKKNAFAVGIYDLTVTSKTGPIAATLLRAITLLQNPAPTITNISPRIITTSSAVINISGTNFQTSSTYTITLNCEDLLVKDNTINSVSSTLIRVTLSLADVNGGTHCTLILTDTTQKYVVNYHGLSVLDATRTLKDWHSYDLPSARCAASAVSTTIDGRDFVYLIGGDTDNSCKGLATTSSVIFTELGEFGEISAWTTTTSLPQARAFASVDRIGEFVYLTGGFDGSSSTNTVFRSEILQPEESPILTGRLAVTSEVHTMLVGVYYYAVSALYKSADASNPGGETLPSNIISVSLPSDPSHSTVLLSWDSVYEASGYNVYRTAKPGQLSSQLVLIAEVSTTEYTDTGSVIPGTATPKVMGSLGNWVSIGNPMIVSRYGHATTTTESNGGVFYLFAFDGLVSSSSVANSYENMMVTVYQPTVSHGREMHLTANWRLGNRIMSHSAYRKAVSLDTENLGYPDYLESVIVGSGKDSNLHSMNYLYNSDSFNYQSFAEANETFHYFGSCMFASDGVLYSIGGTNNTNNYSPVSGAAAYMILNTAVPPSGNPMTVYKQARSSPLIPTAFAACAHSRGNFILIGGTHLTQSISSLIQVVAG